MEGSPLYLAEVSLVVAENAHPFDRDAVCRWKCPVLAENLIRPMGAVVAENPHPLESQPGGMWSE